MEHTLHGDGVTGPVFGPRPMLYIARLMSVLWQVLLKVVLDTGPGPSF